MSKILYVATGGLHRDGITLSQLDCLKNTSMNNIEMHVLALYNDDETIIDEFKKNNCIIKRMCNRKKQVFKYMLHLYKYLKEQNFDIIHVCGSSSIMAIELFIAKLCNVKVRIAHSHNTINNHLLLHKLLNPIFNYSYNVSWACGEDAGNFLFKNKKFEIIHNGRDLNKYKYNLKNREFYRKKFNVNNYILIGNVGNFNYQKNQEFIIKLAMIMDDSYKFCLVGDGPDFDKIYKLCKDNNLLDKVIFTGKIDYVDKLLSAFDIMILPSKFEGLPMVLTEWQANGLPCIVSNNVTKEANVGCNVINLDISESSLEIWKKNIMSNVDCNRKDKSLKNIKELKLNGFEIKTTAKKLETKYLELLKK